LHLKTGDKITIESKGQNPDLRPVDPEFEEWTEAYRKVITDYKGVLKALAE